MRVPEPLIGIRPRIDGKFLRAGDSRLLIKGASYGTFAPDATGQQFPNPTRVVADFAAMARFGLNTVRTYTPPTMDLLDEAARHGLRVMIGIPWAQHVAFLRDRRTTREIRDTVVRHVRELGNHPATLLVAVGNEIPSGIVRWHGQDRIELFLRELYVAAKNAAPECLLTYGNYPPTEYLELPFFDVCAFNIYLHAESDFRAYLARVQVLAGHRPLLLAEAGGDSLRLGEEGQASLVAMQLRTAFSEGACGAIVFSWTDEWWRGGHSIDDWKFGLVDVERRPKLALHAAGRVFATAPFREEQRRSWPKISVVICAHNAADTIDDCLDAAGRLTYPDFEVIVVNDGSTDRTAEIARRHERFQTIDVPNGGLSAARNVGLAAATGDVVAYTDADVRVDPDWLTYLVQPFLSSDAVGVGGPNVVPPDDPWMAQCVARAPGGPTHVLLDDHVAEHVPGCNMAFRRSALVAIGGFNQVFNKAGDDVDVCWRLQSRGWKLGFAPAALVWHHHRRSVRAYFRQQVGYGEGETWLKPHHPEKFLHGHIVWHGHIYSPLPFVRSMATTRVNAGPWGSAAFPSVYRTDAHPFAYMPHSGRWQIGATCLISTGIAVLLTGRGELGVLLTAVGAAALSVTVAKCVAYALGSDVQRLRPIGAVPPAASRFLYRGTIALLHFVQPFARLYGRLRGMLAPPPADSVAPQRAESFAASLATVREVWHSLRLLTGTETQSEFWSETWVDRDGVLTRLVQALRASRAVRGVEVDDGWWSSRDVSVTVGRWATLDVRSVVEEHNEGRCLFRTAIRARPTVFAISAFVTTVGGAAFAGLYLSLSVFPLIALLLLPIVLVVWQTAYGIGVLRDAVARLSRAAAMLPMRDGAAADTAIGVPDAPVSRVHRITVKTQVDAKPVSKRASNV